MGHRRLSRVEAAARRAAVGDESGGFSGLCLVSQRVPKVVHRVRVVRATPLENPGFRLWVGGLLHCLPGSIGYSDPAPKGGFPNVAPSGFQTWSSDGRGD